MKKPSKGSELREIILDLFYPRSCCGCGNILLLAERSICLECRMSLPLTYWHNMPANPLEKVFYARVQVQRATAFLFFRKESVVQNLLHQLKYNSQKELGVLLGLYFGKEIGKAPWVKPIEAIIPVPLHPKKLAKRGYNQSALLALGLAKGLQKAHDFKALKRTRFTETQTKKDRFQRQLNVRDAFECAPFAYKSILIVDDVTTTGATFESAIEAIHKANPHCEINVASLAFAE